MGKKNQKKRGGVVDFRPAGNAIREELSRLGINQRDAAREAGISERSMSAAVNGDPNHCGFGAFAKIARRFGLKFVLNTHKEEE